MKKLKLLGKILDRNEMKKIHGGKSAHPKCSGDCNNPNGNFPCRGAVTDPICFCDEYGSCRGPYLA